MSKRDLHHQWGSLDLPASFLSGFENAQNALNLLGTVIQVGHISRVAISHALVHHFIGELVQLLVGVGLQFRELVGGAQRGRSVGLDSKYRDQASDRLSRKT